MVFQVLAVSIFPTGNGMNINPDQPLSTCPLCLSDEMQELKPWDVAEYEDVVPAKRALCDKCKTIWAIKGQENGSDWQCKANLSFQG